MWHQVNSAIFSIDRFLALWRMQVTTQYILQCWKAAGKTPDMVEDEIPLFLCDEMRGKLTDEQRAFAKERQAEMYDHCQHAVLELFLFLSMLSQGLVGDLRSFCALRFPSGETAEPCPQALAFQSLCERTFQPRRPRTRCGAFRAVLGRIWGTRERGRRKPWRFYGAWAVTSARSAGGFRGWSWRCSDQPDLRLALFFLISRLNPRCDRLSGGADAIRRGF